MRKIDRIQKTNNEKNHVVISTNDAMRKVNYKLDLLADLLVESQTNNSEDVQYIKKTIVEGFIGVFKQNRELQIKNDEMNKAMSIMVKELLELRRERDEKKKRKEARKSRKRFPKRDPMTIEIYKKLIKEIEGTTYIQLRTRIAFCILVVTGIRINELLQLKVSQLETLFNKHWIAINRSKRGPSNLKAFLTPEGKEIVKARKKDFQLLQLMKKPDCYIFSPEANHYKKLDRAVITKDVNKVMRRVSEQLPDKPNITSHSFRIGFITQLWKDSHDIELVRQTMGHRNLVTTSAYVSELSDEERKNRIEQL